jgi:hypothetical protein
MFKVQATKYSSRGTSLHALIMSGNEFAWGGQCLINTLEIVSRHPRFDWDETDFSAFFCDYAGPFEGLEVILNAANRCHEEESISIDALISIVSRLGDARNQHGSVILKLLLQKISRSYCWSEAFPNLIEPLFMHEWDSHVSYDLGRDWLATVQFQGWIYRTT